MRIPGETGRENEGRRGGFRRGSIPCAQTALRATAMRAPFVAVGRIVSTGRGGDPCRDLLSKAVALAHGPRREIPRKDVPAALRANLVVAGTADVMEQLCQFACRDA
jgi:hypothetical protein